MRGHHAAQPAVDPIALNRIAHRLADHEPDLDRLGAGGVGVTAREEMDDEGTARRPATAAGRLAEDVCVGEPVDRWQHGVSPTRSDR